MKLAEREKQDAIRLFESVQRRLWQLYEEVDGTAQVVVSTWTRPVNPSGTPGGGGTLGIMRGALVEKAGAHVSVITGDHYPSTEREREHEREGEGELRGQPFFAASVTAVCHMFNPHVPTAHIRLSLTEVGDRFWVGGSVDLAPTVRYGEDTAAFHAAMRDACDGRSEGDYDLFKSRSDAYFMIPHRGESRRVGGLVFDDLCDDWSMLFPFLEAVGSAFIKVYGTIVRRRQDTPFSDAEKELQLLERARYAEFNLVYDRETRFGLMTGGHPDAVLMSLPPVAKW